MSDSKNTIVTFFDTKSYDKESFQKAPSHPLSFQFQEARLDSHTVALAEGSFAVCVFVNDHLDENCIELLSKLGVRHIALRCAGFNNVDLDAAKKHNITVTRVPAYSPHAVAEHAIALLQTLNRKIHRAHNRVREQNFSLSGLVGFDLYGKTAGIIGTGKIGRILAEILRNGFQMRVIAYDVYPDHDWAKKNDIIYASFDQVLAESDVISLHTPLTPETEHLINEKSLRLMKPSAFIINTSRGKLIDTRALIAALKTQKIGGVALDVYEEEDGVFFEDLSGTVLQDDELARLLTFPNVLITSHQAFLTADALEQIALVTIDNLKNAANKLPFQEGTQLA